MTLRKLECNNNLTRISKTAPPSPSLSSTHADTTTLPLQNLLGIHWQKVSAQTILKPFIPPSNWSYSVLAWNRSALDF